MKQLLILATMLLTFGFAKAQGKIYDDYYGSKNKVIGHYSDGKIYNDYYGSKNKVIGHYDSSGSGAAAAAYIILF